MILRDGNWVKEPEQADPPPKKKKRLVTAAMRAAAKRNARLSTGPKTLEGNSGGPERNHRRTYLQHYDFSRR